MSLAALSGDRFEPHVAELATGVRMAYLREGAGGRPLLLLHGYPETKRIWWRNVEPLAAAGFEVIVPDLRGFGDSGLAPDGFYDLAAHARDVRALLGELGHERCAAVGGDLGGMVAIDLSLRFPGLVERLVVFNTALPELPDRYREAGIPPDPPRTERPESDYFVRQGREADALLAELPTREARLAYVMAFYRERLWAAPGSFTREEARFMAEPFAEAERLRASWGPYEAAMRTRRSSERARWTEPVTVPALVLYGADDHVTPPSFVDRAKVAFTRCTGPFVVPRCGHFVQWEQADVLNDAIRHFAAGAPVAAGVPA
jgi:pimeloyl-ACP methyl ester carboxylesterase